MLPDNSSIIQSQMALDKYFTLSENQKEKYELRLGKMKGTDQKIIKCRAIPAYVPASGIIIRKAKNLGKIANFCGESQIQDDRLRNELKSIKSMAQYTLSITDSAIQAVEEKPQRLLDALEKKEFTTLLRYIEHASSNTIRFKFTNEHGKSLLHIALEGLSKATKEERSHYLTIINALSAHPAIASSLPNLKDDFGNTVAHIAAKTGQVDILHNLLFFHPQLWSRKNDAGDTAASLMCQNTTEAETVILLTKWIESSPQTLDPKLLLLMCNPEHPKPKAVMVLLNAVLEEKIPEKVARSTTTKDHSGFIAYDYLLKTNFKEAITLYREIFPALKHPRGNYGTLSRTSQK